MKKLIFLILSLCLLLCACGEKQTDTAVHTAPGEGTVFPETVWESECAIVENPSGSTFEKPVVIKLASFLDVQNLLNTYGTLVNLEPLGLTEKYDSTFFENSCLVLILMDTHGSDLVPGVDSVDAMGIMTDINITVEKGESETGTVTWLVAVETERSVYDSDVYVYVF